MGISRKATWLWTWVYTLCFNKALGAQQLAVPSSFQTSMNHLSLFLVQLCCPPHSPSLCFQFSQGQNLQCLNSLSEFLCSWILCLLVSGFLLSVYIPQDTEFGLRSAWSTEQPIHLPRATSGSWRDALGNILPNVSGLPLAQSRKYRSGRPKHQPPLPFPQVHDNFVSWAYHNHLILLDITSSCVYYEPVSEKSYLPVYYPGWLQDLTSPSGKGEKW